MGGQDHNIEALRSAGYDDAADLLEKQAAEQARAEAARRGPGVSAREAGLSIPAMGPGPVDALALADAQAARGMLEAINALGADSTLTTPIFNDGGTR